MFSREIYGGDSRLLTESIESLPIQFRKWSGTRGGMALRPLPLTSSHLRVTLAKISLLMLPWPLKSWLSSVFLILPQDSESWMGTSAWPSVMAYAWALGNREIEEEIFPSFASFIYTHSPDLGICSVNGSFHSKSSPSFKAQLNSNNNNILIVSNTLKCWYSHLLLTSTMPGRKVAS